MIRRLLVLAGLALGACAAPPPPALGPAAVPTVGPTVHTARVTLQGTCVAFDETGGRAVVGDRDGAIAVYAGASPGTSWPGIHRGGVLSVSLRGGALASAGADGVVRLTDVASGKAMAEIQTPARIVALSPSGKLLATASDDLGVRVYDAPALALRASLGMPALLEGPTPRPVAPTALAWRGDDATLAVGDAAGEVSVFAARAGARVARFSLRGSRPVTSLDWSSDGATLLVATGEGAVALWDATRASLSRDLRMPTGATHASAVLCADSALVAGDSGPIRRLPLDSPGETTEALAAGSLVRSPDGAVATVDSSGTVVITRDLPCRSAPAYPAPLARPEQSPVVDGTGFADEEGQAQALGAAPLELSPRAINAVSWSADGRWIAAAAVGAFDEAKVWDASSGELVRTLTRGVAEIAWDVAVDAAAAEVAMSTRRGSVAVFRIDDGRLVARIDGTVGDDNTRLAFDPDGRLLARSLPDPGAAASSRSAPGPRGRLAIAALDDLARPALLSTCRVGSVTWPGPIVVRCTDGETFEVWDPASKSLLRRVVLPGVMGVGARGRLAVTCVDPPEHPPTIKGRAKPGARTPPQCRVHDLVRGGEVAIQADVPRHALVAVDEAGRRLAAASSGHVRFWDADGSHRAVWAPAVGNVRALAWSPDGTRCAVGTGDGTMRVWDAVRRVWSFGSTP